jgi:hypothetical protein
LDGQREDRLHHGSAAINVQQLAGDEARLVPLTRENAKVMKNLLNYCGVEAKNTMSGREIISWYIEVLQVSLYCLVYF